jgi:hypothetical protein
MRFRGKGCSPEMAQRIIELLLNDSGVSGLLAGTLNSRLDTPARQNQPGEIAPVVVVGKRRRKSRKLSAQVVEFLHARRDLPIPELLKEVETKFGVTLSSGSVYKAWKMPLAEQQRTA